MSEVYYVGKAWRKLDGSVFHCTEEIDGDLHGYGLDSNDNWINWKKNEGYACVKNEKHTLSPVDFETWFKIISYHAVSISDIMKKIIYLENKMQKNGCSMFGLDFKKHDNTLRCGYMYSHNDENVLMKNGDWITEITI